jgi:hypothetical protein
MKLSDNTLAVLKNFATINPGCAFKAGQVVKTMLPDRTFLATAKVEETFPVDFAIFDLSRLISAIGLVSEPELEFTEKVITIKGDETVLRYAVCDPQTITAANYDKNFVIEGPIAQFELPQAKLQKLRQASQVLNAPHLTIASKDGQTLTIRVHDAKNPSSDNFIVDNKTEVLTQAFELRLEMSKLRLVPDTYLVKISEDGLMTMTGEHVEYAMMGNFE